MTTFRITYLAGKLDTSVCPPAIVPALFPTFDGWKVTLTDSYCDVIVPNGIAPLDLGPLVKVEPISNE